MNTPRATGSVRPPAARATHADADVLLLVSLSDDDRRDEERHRANAADAGARVARRAARGCVRDGFSLVSRSADARPLPRTRLTVPTVPHSSSSSSSGIARAAPPPASRAAKHLEPPKSDMAVRRRPARVAASLLVDGRPPSVLRDATRAPTDDVFFGFPLLLRQEWDDWSLSSSFASASSNNASTAAFSALLPSRGGVARAGSHRSAASALDRLASSSSSSSASGSVFSRVRSIHWFPYDRVGVVNAVP